MHSSSHKTQGSLVGISDILICEDHPFVQMGLEVVLRGLLPHLQSLRKTQMGKQALQMAAEQKPDVAFVDLGLPDISGIELIRQLKQICPDIKIIVLTNCDNPSTLFQVKALGVSGVMQKVSSEEELRQMLKIALSTEDGALTLDRNTKSLLSQHHQVEFTPREYEVLLEVIQGKSNQEIAELLGCALTTVRFHRANILEKTGIRNAAELTAWFFQGQRQRD